MTLRLNPRFLLLGLLVLAAPLAWAQQQIITATITVTNTAGTTNGETITVNGTVRTFTNTVTTAATQILASNTIAAATSNLFTAYVVNPQANVIVSAISTNIVQLQGYPGTVLTVALGTTPTNWGTVTLATNTLTTIYVVRVPLNLAEGLTQQTNIASALVSAIAGTAETNAIFESSPVAANLLGITNAQTVAGVKLFTNTAGQWKGVVSNSPAISGSVSAISNGVYWSGILVGPTTTNLVNRGNAISSPNGSTLQSEQFGGGAVASGIAALAVGNSAAAGGLGSTAVGNGSSAGAANSVALGAGATASSASAIAVGSSATASASQAIALGTSSTAAFSNSVAIGIGATTTATNQIMLGGVGINTVVQNILQVGGSISNSVVTGTNVNNGDQSFTRYALTTLGNGQNPDIVTGTNVFVDVSGPSGAFSVVGITAGRDGKIVTLMNRTGFTMTVACEGGAIGNDPTPANRILTGTGADYATTNNPGAVNLIYNAAASRWVVTSHN